MQTTFATSAPSSSSPPYDPAAAADVRELGAPIQGAPTGGAFGALILAVVTFGFLPGLLWPLRFRHMAEVERRRFGQLVEWLRLNANHPELPRLEKALRHVRFRPFLYLVAIACCAGVVFLFFSAGALTLAAHEQRLLLHCTYSLDSPVPTMSAWLRDGALFTSGWDARQTLFAAWSLGLSVAYLAHWVQAHLYARAVREFLHEFNRIALHEGLSPVFLAPLGLGVRPTWALAGLILLWPLHALWGIPLMLAGAVQRRYAGRAGPVVRSALAERVRDVTLLRRGRLAAAAPAPAPTTGPAASPAPPPAARATPRVRCSTEGCRMAMPAGALFCPRCGRRTAPPLDRVA